MYHELLSSPALTTVPTVPPAISTAGNDGTAPDSTTIQLLGITSDLKQQIADIEQRLDLLASTGMDDLLENIRSYGCKAVEAKDNALSAAHYAILYAWATGSLFNLAKVKLAHGQFGKWRDKVANETGICIRTAQNWMKLAQNCADVRALLVPGGNLAGSYRAVGIIPKPDDPDSKAENDKRNDELPVQRFIELAFTALTNGRKAFRHLEQSGAILGQNERDRLIEEKSAYVELFDKILNPTVI